MHEGAVRGAEMNTLVELRRTLEGAVRGAESYTLVDLRRTPAPERILDEAPHNGGAAIAVDALF